MAYLSDYQIQVIYYSFVDFGSNFPTYSEKDNHNYFWLFLISHIHLTINL